MKKITLATVKKLIRENLEAGKLFIKLKRDFDASDDCVRQIKNASFKVAEKTEKCEKYTLKVKGAWFVGSSNDYFDAYEDEHFKGIEVYNCCGCFIIAVKK